MKVSFLRVTDYVYKTDLGESTDVPIIIVHFGTVFSGSETSAVFVQGIFQISDNYTGTQTVETTSAKWK